PAPRDARQERSSGSAGEALTNGTRKGAEPLDRTAPNRRPAPRERAAQTARRRIARRTDNGMISAFGRWRNAFSSSIAAALAKGHGLPVTRAIRAARLSIHSHSDSLKLNSYPSHRICVPSIAEHEPAAIAFPSLVRVPNRPIVLGRF